MEKKHFAKQNLYINFKSLNKFHAAAKDGEERLPAGETITHIMISKISAKCY
jgi:hypothetical protein